VTAAKLRLVASAWVRLGQRWVNSSQRVTNLWLHFGVVDRVEPLTSRYKALVNISSFSFPYVASRHATTLDQRSV
jgi:hypothetical protein